MAADLYAARQDAFQDELSLGSSMGRSHSWNVLNLVNYVATNYGLLNVVF